MNMHKRKKSESTNYYEESPNYYSLKESPNSDKPDRGSRLISVLFNAGLCFTVLLFLWMILVCKSPNIIFNNEKADLLKGPWTITYMGKTVTAELPYRDKAPAGETAVFETILPDRKDTENGLYNSVMIASAHCYIKVYLEEELLYEFGYDQSMPFSDAPGNGKLIVRLPDEFEGKTLRIEKTGYYDNYSTSLRTVSIGTKNALVFAIFNEVMPIMLMNLCIILISLCLLVAGFFFRRKKPGYQLRYLSIFSIITSLWLILESGGYQFFIGKPALVTNTVFLLFTLIPFSFVRFIMTYECFEKSRSLKVIQYLAFAGFILIHTLQLLGIRNYIQSIFITHTVIVLIVCCMIFKYLSIKLKKEAFTEKHLFVSFFVLAAFTLVDVVRFYITPSVQPTLFSQVGVLIYFLILCSFAVKKVVLDNENSLNKLFYEKVAYKDILTGLPNRNAFEREMEYYRSNPAYCPVITVMDLNELKKINDTLGHTKGDEAICHIADAVRECFGEDAHAFRIGGDEFCVIIRELPEGAVDNRIKLLRERLLTVGREKELPLSLAAGWCRKEASMDMINAFQIADSNMYEDKRRIKSGN